MLPAELILHICELLELRDILSLADTCQSNRALLHKFQKLAKLAPWYNKNLSEHGLWADCERMLDQEPLQFPHESYCKDHFNEPLPRDFQCLQGDINRYNKHRWITCDQGISRLCENGNREILDLRENTQDPMSHDPFSVLKRREYVTFEGQLRCRVANEFVAAAVVASRDKTEISLHVRYDDDAETEIHMVETELKEGSYQVFVIEDMVLVSRSYSRGHDNVFYLLPGGKLTPLDTPKMDSIDGWMQYNGILYKAVLDEDDNMQVATSHYPVEMYIVGLRKYEICQDVRNPRYGMAFCQDEGMLAHVIDLEEQEVILAANEDCFWIVGFSDGRLGRWNFSQDYIMSKAKSRDMKEFVEEDLFEGRQRFIDEHGYLYNFDGFMDESDVFLEDGEEDEEEDGWEDEEEDV